MGRHVEMILYIWCWVRCLQKGLFHPHTLTEISFLFLANPQLLVRSVWPQLRNMTGKRSQMMSQWGNQVYLTLGLGSDVLPQTGHVTNEVWHFWDTGDSSAAFMASVWSERLLAVSAVVSRGSRSTSYRANISFNFSKPTKAEVNVGVGRMMSVSVWGEG